MKNREAQTRFHIIDNLLRNKKKATLELLIDRISEQLGKKISKRTVQSDLFNMRYDSNLGYFAPIVFDKFSYTYRYSDENFSIYQIPVSADDLNGMEFALSVLNKFKELPVIKEFEDALQKIASTVKYNKEIKGLDDFIQFDRPESYKGIEYVDKIVKAMRNNQSIEVIYKSFEKKTEKKLLVEPYFIREYKNRFYLIGNEVSKKDPKILTFGFDRIQSVLLTERTFEKPSTNTKDFYKSAFGVMVTDQKPEKIELSFEPKQGNYIKSQPLHHSQKITKDNETETRVMLIVQINREFIMQILSYGSFVKVLKPESLIKEIKSEIKKMNQLYK